MVRWMLSSVRFEGKRERPERSGWPECGDGGQLAPEVGFFEDGGLEPGGSRAREGGSQCAEVGNSQHDYVSVVGVPEGDCAGLGVFELLGGVHGLGACESGLEIFPEHDVKF